MKWFVFIAVIAAALSSQCKAVPSITWDGSFQYGAPATITYSLVTETPLGTAFPDVGIDAGGGWFLADAAYADGSGNSVQTALAVSADGSKATDVWFLVSPEQFVLNESEVVGPWIASGSISGGDFSLASPWFISFQVPEPTTAVILPLTALCLRRSRRV